MPDQSILIIIFKIQKIKMLCQTLPLIYIRVKLGNTFFPNKKVFPVHFCGTAHCNGLFFHLL